MWYTGLLLVSEESITTNYWKIFGIDYDFPLTDTETAENNVVVPELHSPLTDQQLQELQNRTDPLSDDGNNGINHFSAECTIGMVWGLTALKHYNDKVLWQ